LPDFYGNKVSTYIIIGFNSGVNYDTFLIILRGASVIIFQLFIFFIVNNKFIHSDKYLGLLRLYIFGAFLYLFFLPFSNVLTTISAPFLFFQAFLLYYTFKSFKKPEEKLLDSIIDRLDSLSEEHEAVQFCIKRKIPKEKFKQIYFIDNIKNIVQLNDKYKASIQTEEPRIVFPFYDEAGLLTAVTCRALRGETLRYITVKIADDKPLIYGLDSVDKNKDIYVVEGPIDSLFVENAVAISGTSLDKLSFTSLEKDKLILSLSE
jgi:hypothetical protein